MSTNQPIADSEILTTAFRSNDSALLEKIYIENYSGVEQYILSNNGSREQAKDIFQDAFVAVWQNIRTDRFVPSSEAILGAYIYKVAKNKWIDFLRSAQNKKRVYTAIDDKELEQPDHHNDTEELSRQVAAGFQQLGQSCRELLTDFYFNKESLKNIAVKKNWTEATAKNNKYRCIQKLKEIIKGRI